MPDRILVIDGAGRSDPRRIAVGLAARLTAAGVVFVRGNPIAMVEPHG